MKPPKSRKHFELSSRASLIKDEALRLGFNACGISRVTYLHDDAIHLRWWLNKDYHGDMHYMQNHFNKRVDPSRLVEDAKSVISVILNYFPSGGQIDSGAPVISKYAYGEDYHQVIKRKLKLLLDFIYNAIAPVRGRVFVDSAPVLDRAWAVRAGLGWIGKNSILISPDTGSFVFIGSLIVDMDLAYDNPVGDQCGECNECIKACPTSAIVVPRVVDARKCISYLTVEKKDDIEEKFRNKFNNRVFGCDICQDVCPWNSKAVAHEVREFNPLPGLLEMTREDWYRIDEQSFRTTFAKSSIRRTGYNGLKRNLEFIADGRRTEDQT